MNPNAVWIGVDIGTHGVRVAAYDSSGRLVAEGHSSYQPLAPHPGWMVHHAVEDWWSGFLLAARTVSAAIQHDEVRAIGLSGLFPAACLFDHRGEPVGDAVLYGDTRARAEIATVERRLGTTLTGDEVVPRLLWLKRHAPEDFSRCDIVLGPAGYIGFRLTGAASIDPHSAFRWGGITSATRDRWNVDAIAQLHLDPRLFPPIVSSNKIIGTITADASVVTGLPTGTPVIAGTTDTLATLIGHGLIRRRDAMIHYGSSGYLAICTENLELAIRDPQTIGPDVPYKLAAYAVRLGSFLDRIRKAVFASSDFTMLDASAELVPSGAEGLFVVPYSIGAPPSRLAGGQLIALVGFGLHHRAPHLWRALLESFGYILIDERRSLDSGAPVTVAAGGGARSNVWRQIISDMTGWRQQLALGNGASRGAALVAGYGCGDFDSLTDVADRWSTQSRGALTTPSGAKTAQYGDLFLTWQRLAAALGTTRAPH